MNGSFSRMVREVAVGPVLSCMLSDPRRQWFSRLSCTRLSTKRDLGEQPQCQSLPQPTVPELTAPNRFS